MNAEVEVGKKPIFVGYKIFFDAVNASKSVLQPLKVSDGKSLDDPVNALSISSWT